MVNSRLSNHTQHQILSRRSSNYQRPHRVPLGGGNDPDVVALYRRSESVSRPRRMTPRSHCIGRHMQSEAGTYLITAAFPAQRPRSLGSPSGRSVYFQLFISLYLYLSIYLPTCLPIKSIYLSSVRPYCSNGKTASMNTNVSSFV